MKACRGDLIDSGITVTGNGMDVVDGPEPSYRIPTIADFLIYYSTAPGFKLLKLWSVFPNKLVLFCSFKVIIHFAIQATDHFSFRHSSLYSTVIVKNIMSIF
jgi:hypothetical protein